MKLSEIRNILDAEVISGEEHMERSVFGGGGADLIEDMLSAVAQGSVFLTGLNSEQVIRSAKIAEVAAVVFIRGRRPKTEVIELARSYDLPVLVTEYPMFVASGRLYMNGLRGLDGSW